MQFPWLNELYCELHDQAHQLTSDVISWTTRYTSETNLLSNLYTNSDLQGNRCQDQHLTGPTPLAFYWDARMKFGIEVHRENFNPQCYFRLRCQRSTSLGDRTFGVAGPCVNVGSIKFARDLNTSQWNWPGMPYIPRDHGAAATQRLSSSTRFSN